MYIENDKFNWHSIIMYGSKMIFFWRAISVTKNNLL